MSGVQSSLAKVKTEAERLDVMDKAAGILAELLYTDQLLSQIKEYRTIMLPVSGVYITIDPVRGILKCIIVLGMSGVEGSMG